MVIDVELQINDIIFIINSFFLKIDIRLKINITNSNINNGRVNNSPKNLIPSIDFIELGL